MEDILEKTGRGAIGSKENATVVKFGDVLDCKIGVATLVNKAPFAAFFRCIGTLKYFVSGSRGIGNNANIKIGTTAGICFDKYIAARRKFTGRIVAVINSYTAAVNQGFLWQGAYS
jgi:hypothetical protein